MNIYVFISFVLPVVLALIYFLVLMKFQPLLINSIKIDLLIVIFSLIPPIIVSSIQNFNYSSYFFGGLLLIMTISLYPRIQYANLLTLSLCLSYLTTIIIFIISFYSIFQKQINYYDGFYLLAVLLPFTSNIYLSIALIVRKIRFNYILLQLPKNGRQFYINYRLFIPQNHQIPYLENFQWLQLSRMAVLIQCQRKRLFKLIINRQKIYDDIVNQISIAPLYMLKYPLFVQFKGEIAVDTGGLKNEMVTILSQYLFVDIQTSIFTLNEDGQYLLTDRCCPQNAFLLGWLIGKALYHNTVISFNVSNLLLAIMSNNIQFNDIQDYDFQFAKFIQDSENYDDVYKEYVDILGTPKLVSQKPRKISLQHAVYTRYFKNSIESIKYLQKGFMSTFPIPASYFLNTQLISTIFSTKLISVEDWRTHTIIKCSHEIANIFFNMLENNETMRSKILKFSTGMSNVPNNSFLWLGKPLFSGEIQQQFKLESIASHLLPMSSTCSFTLKIPIVSSEEILRQRFLIALECDNLEIP